MLCGFFVCRHLPLRRACNAYRGTEPPSATALHAASVRSGPASTPHNAARQKKRACYSLVAGPFL